MVTVPTKSAQLIKTGYMIQMRMGVEHAIHLRQIFSQRLFSQIGSRVDKDGGFRSLQMNGGPGTLELGVGRCTGLTAATDDGNTSGCTGAQNGKANFRFQLGSSFA